MPFTIEQRLAKLQLLRNEETLKKNKRIAPLFTPKRCAICKNIFKSLRDKHKDHCHKRDMQRDTLCHSCNVGLGFFKDNVKTLRAAIKYLQKWNNEHRKIIEERDAFGKP